MKITSLYSGILAMNLFLSSGFAQAGSEKLTGEEIKELQQACDDALMHPYYSREIRILREQAHDEHLASIEENAETSWAAKRINHFVWLHHRLPMKQNANVLEYGVDKEEESRLKETLLLFRNSQMFRDKLSEDALAMLEALKFDGPWSAMADARAASAALRANKLYAETGQLPKDKEMSAIRNYWFMDALNRVLDPELRQKIAQKFAPTVTTPIAKAAVDMVAEAKAINLFVQKQRRLPLKQNGDVSLGGVNTEEETRLKDVLTLFHTDALLRANLSAEALTMLNAINFSNKSSTMADARIAAMALEVNNHYAVTGKMPEGKLRASLRLHWGKAALFNVLNPTFRKKFELTSVPKVEDMNDPNTAEIVKNLANRLNQFVSENKRWPRVDSSVESESELAVYARKFGIHQENREAIVPFLTKETQDVAPY